MNLTARSEVALDLILPHGRVGGIGIVLEEEEQGISVIEVLRAGGAYDAGIESGDAIVEIEGQDCSSMDREAFQQVSAGPEGSFVDVVVRKGATGEHQAYAIERKAFPGADTDAPPIW